MPGSGRVGGYFPEAGIDTPRLEKGVCRYGF
jgi:hypothetical protein